MLPTLVWCCLSGVAALPYSCVGLACLPGTVAVESDVLLCVHMHMAYCNLPGHVVGAFVCEEGVGGSFCAGRMGLFQEVAIMFSHRHVPCGNVATAYRHLDFIRPACILPCSCRDFYGIQQHPGA